MDRSLDLTTIAVNYSKDFLEKKENIEAVFLIGSVARGDADNYSDIDLLVITKDPLAVDQQDNMEKIRFQEENISLIYTNLKKLEENISQDITPDICFSKEATPLFDPQNLHKRIKLLVDNHKVNINLASRIENAQDGIKDTKRYQKIGEIEQAKMIILTTALFLIKGYIQYNNSPYVSTKFIMKELKKINTEVYQLYKSLWRDIDLDEMIIKLESIISIIRA